MTSFKIPIIPPCPTPLFGSGFGPNRAITLCPEHAHYLFNVMRIKVGDQVRLFNGRDGEWAGKIVSPPRNRL